MATVLQSWQIFVAAAASRVNRNNATLPLAVSCVEGRRELAVVEVKRAP